MGSKGQGPDARDGVVTYALAQDLIEHTCHVFQVQHAAGGGEVGGSTDQVDGMLCCSTRRMYLDAILTATGNGLAICTDS